MQAKILIIEDVKEMSDLIALYLGNEGMDTKQAETAEEALEILNDYNPSLIVLDLNLPGMDGFEFLHHFRKKFALFQKKICVLLSFCVIIKERIPQCLYPSGQNTAIFDCGDRYTLTDTISISIGKSRCCNAAYQGILYGLRASFSARWNFSSGSEMLFVSFS